MNVIEALGATRTVLAEVSKEVAANKAALIAKHGERKARLIFLLAEMSYTLSMIQAHSDDAAVVEEGLNKVADSLDKYAKGVFKDILGVERITQEIGDEVQGIVAMETDFLITMNAKAASAILLLAEPPASSTLQ